MWWKTPCQLKLKSSLKLQAAADYTPIIVSGLQPLPLCPRPVSLTMIFAMWVVIGAKNPCQPTRPSRHPRRGKKWARCCMITVLVCQHVTSPPQLQPRPPQWCKLHVLPRKCQLAVCPLTTMWIWVYPRQCVRTTRPLFFVEIISKVPYTYISNKLPMNNEYFNGLLTVVYKPVWCMNCKYQCCNSQWNVSTLYICVLTMFSATTHAVSGAFHMEGGTENSHKYGSSWRHNLVVFSRDSEQGESKICCCLVRWHAIIGFNRDMLGLVLNIARGPGFCSQDTEGR